MQNGDISQTMKKRYRYVIATHGHYFAVKGGYRGYKRFFDTMTINSHSSLIELLDALKLADVHYTVITSVIKS